MSGYVPILKGMPGEIVGWANLSPAAGASSSPIFEVVPKYGTLRDLENFSDRIAGSGRQSEMSVDLGHLDQQSPVGSTSQTPVEWLTNVLTARGVSFRPVVRFDDTSAVLRLAGASAATQGTGVVVRWGGYEADPDIGLATTELARVLHDLGAPTSKIHLVIDLFEVADHRTLARATATAIAAVDWAAANGPWGSVTVAGGAFPASVSNLAKSTENRLDRLDAQLWRFVQAQTSIDFNFGDYGVNHPTLPAGIPRAPLPSLRYTDGGEWIVWRESKVRPGNESFFTVCERIVNLPSYRGAQYSWGDSEIARCARSIPGAGTATQWRSYALSHHAEMVTERLSTLGEP